MHSLTKLQRTNVSSWNNELVSCLRGFYAAPSSSVSSRRSNCGPSPQIHAIAEMCSLALSLHSFTGTEKKPVGHELSAQVWKCQHVLECVLHFMLPSEWPAASQQREAQGWVGGLCERAASQSCRGGGRSHKSGWMAEATVCSDGEGLGKVYHNLSDPQMLLFPDQDRIGCDHSAYHWSCRKEHWN